MTLLGRSAARSSRIGLRFVSKDIGDLVQMGIDVVGQRFELAPGLAELLRLVGGAQEITAFPLNIIHDTTPIDATMKANRNEPWLTLHEASSVRHERQCLSLPSGFSFDDGNLCDWLLLHVDLRHSELHSALSTHLPNTSNEPMTTRPSAGKWLQLSKPIAGQAAPVGGETLVSK